MPSAGDQSKTGPRPAPPRRSPALTEHRPPSRTPPVLSSPPHRRGDSPVLRWRRGLPPGMVHAMRRATPGVGEAEMEGSMLD